MRPHPLTPTHQLSIKSHQIYDGLYATALQSSVDGKLSVGEGCTDEAGEQSEVGVKSQLRFSCVRLTLSHLTAFSSPEIKTIRTRARKITSELDLDAFFACSRIYCRILELFF